MTRPLVTSTRRGLVLVFYSDALLASGLGLFLLAPSHAPGYALLGMTTSAVLGLPALLVLWAGRREFGPGHARDVRRAVAAFGVLGLALGLAYTQLDAFEHATLRVRDLWAPWFFLGFALVCDAAGLWFLLRGLVASRGRAWLHAVPVVGLGTAAAFLAWTAPVVEDLLARSGGVAANPAEAASYVRDVWLRVVRPFAGGLLVLRVAVWPALYAAITDVAEAEQDASAASAPPSAPGSAPP